MSVNSADWIQCDVRSREFSSFGSIRSPRDHEMVKQIVGSDDYYLKLTMKTHRIDYIHYDYKKEEFQFWGEYQSCIYAMKEIHHRIEKISSRYFEDDTSRLEDVCTPDDICTPEDVSDDEECTPYDIYKLEDDLYNSQSQSPYYTSASDADDYVFPEEPKALTLEEQYGKVAKKQMSKMGFVTGAGLGLKNNGRVEPIHPISELGGRTKNLYRGLGYIEPPPKREAEDYTSSHM